MSIEEVVDPIRPAAEVLPTSPLTIDPKNLDRHECSACGYVYEPAKGEERGRIAAGVPLEALPADWKCPVCGAPRSRFQNIGPIGSPSGFKANLKYGLGVNTLTPGQKNILIFGGLVVAFLIFLSLYGLQ